MSQVTVAGMMSGTSMDGVDLAALTTDGVSIQGFGDTRYRPYTEPERDTLRQALGTWPGDPLAEAAARVVELAHTETLAGFADVAYVGFHGQTLAHDPGGARTHQAGDGAQLAKSTGRRIVWDFRSSDMQLGGQGAPLAPFYHWALARYLKADAPLAFLNLGGVGNLTWVDPRRDTPEQNGACVAFDTGPANAPIDDMMQTRLGTRFDEGGALSSKGQVDGAIVARFLEHRYFRKIPPKSLDRDGFPELQAWVGALPDADAVATLAACAAGAVAVGLEHVPSRPARVLVTGGGRHNRGLMEMLRVAIGQPVEPVEKVGLDGDALEAQAFAYLAVRVARGLPTSAPTTTGVAAAVGGGRVSDP